MRTVLIYLLVATLAVTAWQRWTFRAELVDLRRDLEAVQGMLEFPPRTVLCEISDQVTQVYAAVATHCGTMHDTTVAPPVVATSCVRP